MSGGTGVGLVGLGRMGSIHAANLAGRIPGARLAMVVDADEGRAREAGRRLGGVPWSTRMEEMLGDPGVEAVVVATPTALHADGVEAAAASGRPVFCEKPISLDLDRTYEVVEAVRAAGIAMQVGFHRRFDPDYRAAREKIQVGEVGEVYLMRTSLRDMAAPDPSFLRGSGGFFADVTIHDFDAARWLVGEIEEVTAFGAALSDPGFREIGDLDNAVAVLRFGGGALGVVDNSRVAGYGYECQTEVMGSRGTLRIGRHRRRGLRTLLPGEVREDHVADFSERFEEAYRAELEHFLSCVREGREPEVGGAEAAAAFVISQAAERSLREGRTVRLESERRRDGIRYRMAD